MTEAKIKCRWIRFIPRALFVLTCAMCLVGIIAVVPRRLVAQEKQRATEDHDTASRRQSKTAAEPAATAASGEAADAPKLDAATEKSIVGTWRGGRKSELEFFSDGRIEEFPAELVPSKGEAASTKVKFHGRWSIDSRLGPPILDIEAAGVGSLRGLPVIQRDEGSPAVRFSIDRLDDSFLRLTELGNARSAAFYRRADKHDAEPKFDASLPPKLRQMFLLARLAPDEALALRNWLGPDREGDIELIRFEALEKLDKARHGTLDFAELFGLEKDEAAAFRELYKQTHGSLNYASYLVKNDQLSAVEIRAVKKVEEFLKQVRDEDQRAYDWYYQFFDSHGLFGTGPGRTTSRRVGETYDAGLRSPPSLSNRMEGGQQPEVHRNAVESLAASDRAALDAVQKFAEFAREEDDYLSRAVLGER